jgi:hypothetical protein
VVVYLVGSDVMKTWLDEALASFSSMLYWEKCTASI